MEDRLDTNNSDPTVYNDSIFLSSFSHGCALLSLKNGSPSLYDSKVVFNNLSPGAARGILLRLQREAKKDTEMRCLDLPTANSSGLQGAGFGSIISTKAISSS